MKNKLLAISLLAIFALSCGVASNAASMSVPMATQTATALPVITATQPKPTVTPLPTLEIGHIVGGWNIRSSPGGNVIDQVTDITVTVLSYKSGWAEIEYSGNVGWVHMDSLRHDYEEK